uniref:PH domain-containing protein n=1 Tax=Cyprinodon variegatus TaxID=28743 RepID=A0A3Q2DQW2_CYPVA
MQKSVRYNEGHALFLSAVARKEGTKRGYLSKKTAENSRWSEKFFALYQNVLFYFENEQSARPAGIYLLEGCTCERTPAPKISTTGKEALEKQVRYYVLHSIQLACRVVIVESWSSPSRRDWMGFRAHHTDCMVNLIWCGSDLHTSNHEIF